MKSTPKAKNNSSAVNSVHTYDTYLRIRPYIHSSIVCAPLPRPALSIDSAGCKGRERTPFPGFYHFFTTCSLQVGEDWIISCCEAKVKEQKSRRQRQQKVTYGNIRSGTTCKIGANFPEMASLGGAPTFKKKSEKFVVVSLRPL